MAFLSLALLTAAALAATGPSPVPPDEVKAAFLCSFPEFVDWPAGSPGPLTLEILGEDPFGTLIDETARARIGGPETIEIRRSPQLQEGATPDIVFVSASEAPRLDQLLAELAERPVLTVSDIPGFAERGGVIGFVIEDRRVRFEINVGAAERSGLRISSRLLNLARIVATAPRRPS